MFMRILKHIRGRRRKGVLSLDILITGALVFAGGIIVFNMFQGETKLMTNTAKDQIVAKEDIGGKHIIYNPNNVEGVGPNDDGEITFDPDFNDQTVIINKLFYENSKDCTLTNNNAYQCDVDVGNTIYIYPKWGPANATKTSLLWKQINGKENAMTVQSFDTHSLEIYGKKAGTTTIQTKTIDGGNQLIYAYINVLQPITEILLDKYAATLNLSEPSQTIKVKATVNPTDASDKLITWKFMKGDSGPQECVKLLPEGHELTIAIRPECKLSTTGIVKIVAVADNGIEPVQPLVVTINKK